MEWISGLSSTFATVFFIFSLGVHGGQQFTEQRLACFFYDKINHQNGISILNTGLPSIWAKGLADEDIYLSGTYKDGFFIISGMSGQTQSWFGPRLVANYENSLALAKHFCQRGIKYAFSPSQEDKELVHLGAKSSFLSIKNLPVVFKHQNKNYIKTINKVVVFGDSLSDQGNLKKYLRIFPNSPYFAGRFSDHLIWIDYMQKLTGISVQNFALGGSMSNIFLDLEFNQKSFSEKSKRIAKSFIAGSLSQQIDKFKTHSLDNGQVTDPNGTLFSVWIGGNDYIALMESASDVDIFLDYPRDQRIGLEMVVERVTESIVKGVQNLYDMGARNFILVNIPDLGKLPRILENQTYHAKMYEQKKHKIFLLSKKMSDITKAHNSTLNTKIEKLKQINSGLNMILIDTYNEISNLSQSINIDDNLSHFDYDLNPDFGTTIVEDGEQITLQRPCYTGTEIEANQTLMCKEPHRAVFWDKTHPSSYMHCLFAAYFHQQAAKNEVLEPVGFLQYLKMCRPELAAALDSRD